MFWYFYQKLVIKLRITLDKGHLIWYDGFCFGGCGEAVNAPDCGSGTRGFDPLHPPQILGCSQAVRHRSLESAFRWFESSHPSQI